MSLPRTRSKSAISTVTVIDPSSNTVVGNIPVTQSVNIDGIVVSGSSPSNIAYDPDNGYLYVTDSNGLINVLDPASSSVIGGIIATSMGSVDNIVFDPSNHDFYVASFFSGVVCVMSTK